MFGSRRRIDTTQRPILGRHFLTGNQAAGLVFGKHSVFDIIRMVCLNVQYRLFSTMERLRWSRHLGCSRVSQTAVQFAATKSALSRHARRATLRARAAVTYCGFRGSLFVVFSSPTLARFHTHCAHATSVALEHTCHIRPTRRLGQQHRVGPSRNARLCGRFHKKSLIAFSSTWNDSNNAARSGVHNDTYVVHRVADGAQMIDQWPQVAGRVAERLGRGRLWTAG